MQIVRVLDTDGNVQVGRRDGEVVRRIEGDLFGTFEVTDRAVSVGKLLAPVQPPNIFAIGRNYVEHAAETGAEVPEQPVVFIKATTSLNDPGGPIILPTVAKTVDYECELAVVIGKTARNVSEGDALGYVLGYTCANDISARYWQRKLGQWARAKSFDSFCPLGPWIETDIADPNDLAISTTLNGEVLQQASTSQMIFPVRKLISFLSADLTLLPGTVLLTGTPSGVGMARDPQVWLADGDEVTVAIEGIGELTNPVAASAG